MAIRIDKFLKMAHLVKRRSAAQEMIELGAVRVHVNDNPESELRTCKSSAEVHEGSILDIAYMTRVLRVRVLCADEAILKRNKAGAAWEQLSERPVSPDADPWQ